MSKLFKNKINIETGQVFSIREPEKEIGYISDDGYKMTSNVYDIFGNKYYGIHQIIYAEAYNHPKHLWPVDENGKMFEVDHKNTKRSDNRYTNLRLLSHGDNNGTKETRENHSKRIFSTETKKKMSESHKGMIPLCNPQKTVYQYDLKGNLIAIWPSTKEAARQTGFAQSHICGCCNGKLKTYKGFRWSYVPLTNDR